MGKKIVLVVLLLAVAVLLFRILGKRAGMFASQEPPQWVQGQHLRLIDTKTLEVIELPTGEWYKLGRNELFRYKNPKTGQYTMAAIMICRNCGAEIPKPPLPPLVNALAREAEKNPALKPELDEAQSDLNNFVCPKCGKSPYVGRGPGSAAPRNEKSAPPERVMPGK
jgi:hypothetical protein